MFAAGFCGYSDTEEDCTWAPVTGFLVGAAIGFPVGSLIGGAFRKPPVGLATGQLVGRAFR
jgi:hypothetical protein